MFGLLLIASAVRVAHAQANMVFSGGNGSPLTITVAAPVSYTVTDSLLNNGPFFVIQGVGDVLKNTGGFIGNLSYSINGGSGGTIGYVGSGLIGGAVSADDFYAFGAFANLPVGATVTLKPSTITTYNAIAAAVPVSGAYTTFLTDTRRGAIVSTNGVVIPEANTVALLEFTLPLVGSLVVQRRHKSAETELRSAR